MLDQGCVNKLEDDPKQKIEDDLEKCGGRIERFLRRRGCRAAMIPARWPPSLAKLDLW